MPDGKIIYLSLGSNLGDRATNLARAIDRLPEAGVSVLRRSSLYETEPVDFLDQPWFLNCAVEAETSLPPQQLLFAAAGNRTPSWEARNWSRAAPASWISIFFSMDEAASARRKWKFRILAWPSAALCSCRLRSLRPRSGTPSFTRQLRTCSRPRKTRASCVLCSADDTKPCGIFRQIAMQLEGDFFVRSGALGGNRNCKYAM